MKKIECIIPNHKLLALEIALKEQGVRGMTVTEVKGFGQDRDRPDTFLLLSKTKIEIYSNDHQLEDIITRIQLICRTGQKGDGKIAIYEIEDVMRLRTGERGEIAV
jgi:nitrogen regulatory protein PII